jgi:hypothetical protein
MAFGRRISNYFSIHLHNVQLIWTALDMDRAFGPFKLMISQDFKRQRRGLWSEPGTWVAE